MDRVVSLAAFEGSPVVISDTGGKVRAWNRDAEILLGDRALRSGRRCWEILGLRSRSGTDFCSESCPLQHFACRQARLPRFAVKLERPGREPRSLEMLAFRMPSWRAEGREAILHLLLPAEAKGRTTRDDEGEGLVRLDRLSSRERQVLEMLAGGLGTSAIADRLCIARNTVRNHVQHVLEKLEVHSRIEAIVLFLRHSS